MNFEIVKRLKNNKKGDYMAKKKSRTKSKKSVKGKSTKTPTKKIDTEMKKVRKALEQEMKKAKNKLASAEKKLKTSIRKNPEKATKIIASVGVVTGAVLGATAVALLKRKKSKKK